MKNPVLILTHNCLEKTKRCIASIMKQDIETFVFVIDNGSTDGTREWLTSINTDDFNGVAFLFPENRGVSHGWNYGLDCLFSDPETKHVFCVNNDTELPPWWCRTILSYEGPFITGVSVGSLEEIAEPPPQKELAPFPDFSAWMMRRECWEKIGHYDENMVHYASDLDYHIRAHRAGVRLMNAGTPFFHERSSTLRLASDVKRQQIEAQANMDRTELRAKWGCNAWDNSYAAMFDEQYFGVDK